MAKKRDGSAKQQQVVNVEVKSAQAPRRRRSKLPNFGQLAALLVTEPEGPPPTIAVPRDAWHPIVKEDLTIQPEATEFVPFHIPSSGAEVWVSVQPTTDPDDRVSVHVLSESHLKQMKRSPKTWSADAVSRIYGRVVRRFEDSRELSGGEQWYVRVSLDNKERKSLVKVRVHWRPRQR